MVSAFLPVLISWIQQSGYPVLWLIIFVAAIGIPLPVSIILLAAGAFAALGDFNIFWLGIVALTASVCGDSVGYLIGRLVGVHFLAWLQRPHRFTLVSAETLRRSHVYFNKHGGWAIFFSRFLVSALGGVINLVSGAEVYPYKRFLLFDIFGEASGAIISLTLGYIFGASWDAIGDIVGTTSFFILMSLVAIYPAYRILRGLRGFVASYLIKAQQVKRQSVSQLQILKRPDSLPL